MSAAYAGYGRGLCANYTDSYACEREEWLFPSQDILHVDFNRESLSCTIKSLRTATDGLVDAAFIDPNLGFSREDARLAISPETDSTRYWATISARIRELVISYKLPITKVLLTGTSAANIHFRAALRDALHGIITQDMLDVLDSDDDKATSSDEMKNLFEFATARGAAEIAKRRQEGPVSCAQTDECRERRERRKHLVLKNKEPDGKSLGGLLV